MADFRFQNLEVWKMATEIGHRIADLAEVLDKAGHAVFATKLYNHSPRVAGILAAGSNSSAKAGFGAHVAQARAATLEIASLVIFLGERELITGEQEAELVNMLKRESKMLDNFRQSLERISPSDAALTACRT